MPKKEYQILEHTADIGISIKGSSLRDIFTKAAAAMFDIIAECAHPQKAQPIKIDLVQQAEDVEELFVNWLNELLSLAAAKDLIFSGFQIKHIDEKHLEAVVIGDQVRAYKINKEIKAATYHQLSVKKCGHSWQAQVIFDV